MILFHPLQNRAIQFSLALLAMLQYSPKVPYEDVRALAEDFYLDPLYLESVIATLEKSGIVTLEKQGRTPTHCCRCQSSDGSFVLPRMPAGDLEKEYLRYILQLPEAELFLPSELRQQLRRDEKTWLHEIQRIAPSQTSHARPVNGDTFRQILRGIREKRMICYQFRVKDSDQCREAQSVPWKLEYSAYDKRWWAILYDPEEKRTIKAVLANLQNVTLGKKHGISEAAIREAIDGLCLKDTPVQLRVENVRNALQRCFLLFENQEFIQTQKLSDNTYLLSFRYYRFDTEEILRKLMMLGPAVTLMQPGSLKQELRKRISAALNKLPND